MAVPSRNTQLRFRCFGRVCVAQTLRLSAAFKRPKEDHFPGAGTLATGNIRHSLALWLESQLYGSECGSAHTSGTSVPRFPFIVPISTRAEADVLPDRGRI